MNNFLVCNAGMSTSVLVKKMKDEATKKSVEVNIEAFSVEILDSKVENADVILVGPQIRHMLPQIKEIVGDKCEVSVIDMRDYGMINGAAVLDKALKLIK